MRRPARAPAPTEAIAFTDQDLLHRLCGPADAHLALIEDAFDVRLAAPGGRVTVSGPDAGRASASKVLHTLYDQLGSGQPVSEPEVRAAIAMARAPLDGPGGPAAIQVGSGKRFEARTPRQADYVRALQDPRNGLVFGVGPAGTGKTFLAVAHGAALMATRQVERLIITRPAVEAGERLGFLPGDLEEKVDPYMLPIWDALRDSLGPDKMEKRRAEGRIEVAPLAFMRGRTLSNAFVVVDEAQNATVSQMQMVLTRIGAGTSMAVTGDPSQVDLPRGRDSGLAHALGILDNVEGIAAVRFTREDVVRHPLVARIVGRYADDAKRRASTGEPAA